MFAHFILDVIASFKLIINNILDIFGSPNQSMPNKMLVMRTFIDIYKHFLAACTAFFQKEIF